MNDDSSPSTEKLTCQSPDPLEIIEHKIHLLSRRMDFLNEAVSRLSKDDSKILERVQYVEATLSSFVSWGEFREWSSETDKKVENLSRNSMRRIYFLLLGAGLAFSVEHFPDVALKVFELIVSGK